MTARNDQEAGPWWQAATQDAATRPTATFHPSSSRYKGVVPLPNGQWEAQLHERQHHLWLGSAAAHFRDPGAFVNAIAQEEDEDDNDDDQYSKNHSSDYNSSAMPMAMAQPPPPWEETMFEKPLTPSDVGKLNRLVIPKQYAERYFPLDPASGDKGLQLSFEDESGKVWRFRYSYWNSSQSYVLTKGWSRYVKEKRLGAGDIVSFHRGDRLYILWRRRGGDDRAEAQQPLHSQQAALSGGWGPLVVPGYPEHPGPPGGAVVYVRASHHRELFHPRMGEGEGMVENAVPVGSSKRVVRLFGVNLDCPMELPQPARTDCWTPSTFYSPVCSHGSAPHPP